MDRGILYLPDVNQDEWKTVVPDMSPMVSEYLKRAEQFRSINFWLGRVSDEPLDDPRDGANVTSYQMARNGE